MHPIEAYLRTNLITSRAVAPHMTARGSGTILTLSAGASRVLPPGSLGYGTACATIETGAGLGRRRDGRTRYEARTSPSTVISVRSG